MAPAFVGDVGDDDPTVVIPGAGGPPLGASTATMSAAARSDPTEVFPAAASRRPGRRGLLWVALAVLALVLVGGALSRSDGDLPTPTTTASGTAPTTTTTEAIVVAPPTTAAPPSCAAQGKGTGKGKGRGEKDAQDGEC